SPRPDRLAPPVPPSTSAIFSGVEPGPPATDTAPDRHTRMPKSAAKRRQPRRLPPLTSPMKHRGWVQFFRTIPPLAIIPLAIVLMGVGEEPKIFVIFLAAFLACVISTFQGVVQVDRTLINAARVLGAKDGTIFVRIVVPASTPFILVGMRVGLGAAWATVVAA